MLVFENTREDHRIARESFQESLAFATRVLTKRRNAELSQAYQKVWEKSWGTILQQERLNHGLRTQTQAHL